MGRTGEQRRWEKMRGELEVSLKVKDMQRREIKKKKKKTRPDQLELKDEL